MGCCHCLRHCLPNYVIITVTECDLGGADRCPGEHSDFFHLISWDNIQAMRSEHYDQRLSGPDKTGLGTTGVITKIDIQSII